MPKLIYSAVEKERNPPFDNGGFFIEMFFARRQKKKQFGVGEGLQLIDLVVGAAEIVIPNPDFQICHCALSCFRNVAQCWDSSREDIVEVKVEWRRELRCGEDWLGDLTGEEMVVGR